GINGSGKTTLLKILHSALSTDTPILEGLPFRRARVDVFLNRHNSVFTRTFEQPGVGLHDEGKEPAPTSLAELVAAPGSSAKSKTQWKSDPEEPSGSKLTHYTGGYLPITRLYRVVGSGVSGARAMSEEELDARFVKQV